MAMKLVCDSCDGPIGEVEAFQVVRGNGDFHLTGAGIYLSGSFRVQVDQRGGDADLCVPCVLKLLAMSTLINVRDGAKVQQG